jgi:hypothetical protein
MICRHASPLKLIGKGDNWNRILMHFYGKHLEHLSGLGKSYSEGQNVEAQIPQRKPPCRWLMHVYRSIPEIDITISCSFIRTKIWMKISNFA